MQEHISKLFLYPVIIAVDEGIAKLINLLNGVFPKAFICLFGIPGAFRVSLVGYVVPYFCLFIGCEYVISPKWCLRY